MKTYLLKTLFFIALPILIYITFGTILKKNLRNNIENHQIIILGDSQTEFIRFPKVYNRSIHGSPFYVHYEFVKEFIEQIKGKKVYIACNYHNFSKLYQNRLANDSLYPGWRLNTFKTLNKYNLFNHKYSEIRPKDLGYSFFDIKKTPRLFKDLYLAKPSKNSPISIINDTLSIEGAIHRHWNHPKYILSDSIQKTYLKKLISLLKENNCDIVLLKMPLSNFYLDNVPNKIKRQLTQLPNNYKIRLLNLNDTLKISKDYTYFKDYGHLNLRGDSLVTEYFAKYEIKVRTHNNVYKK